MIKYSTRSRLGRGTVEQVAEENDLERAPSGYWSTWAWNKGTGEAWAPAGDLSRMASVVFVFYDEAGRAESWAVGRYVEDDIVMTGNIDCLASIMRAVGQGVV